MTLPGVGFKIGSSWIPPQKALRLRSPLNQLPWDIAQDQFGSQGADFIGVMGALLIRFAQDQFVGYVFDSNGDLSHAVGMAAQPQLEPGVHGGLDDWAGGVCVWNFIKWTVVLSAFGCIGLRRRRGFRPGWEPAVSRCRSLSGDRRLSAHPGSRAT